MMWRLARRCRYVDVRIGVRDAWDDSREWRTYHLPRIVGSARALEFLWTGDTIDARSACEVGLINRSVPEGQLTSVTYGSPPE